MTDIEKLPRVQAHEEYVRLQILSGFLNLGNKPKTGLEEYVWNVLGLRKNMAEAKAAQSNLQHILIPLTNPKKRPSLDEAEALVKRLIRHVNRWKFSSKWEVEFGATAEIGYPEEVSPDLRKILRSPKGQARLLRMPEEREWKMTVTSTSGQTEWVIWLVRPQPYISRGAVERIYHVLNDLLQTGGLQKLKSCPECQRFFAAEDQRKQFCSAPCRIAYNNRERLAGGYFQELRNNKRNRDLNKARKLLKEGKSPEKLKRETGLSLRVLRREGLVK